MIILNKQQQEAVEKSYDWFVNKRSQIFTIVGRAGTGKTTIVSSLINKLGLKPDEVLFMAYVGKAAMVLSMKGNNAKTIHASIYDFVKVNKYDEFGRPVMKLGRPVTRMSFEKKQSMPPNIKLLVIDEASMVNKQIALDILSFGLPIIALGDLNQLPPVFGQPYFLSNPDVILTEIMRQAKGNPIVTLANMMLDDGEIPLGIYGSLCKVIKKEEVTDKMLATSDIILCAKNKTRNEINDYVRSKIYKRTNRELCVGDKVICRKNNWSIRLPESNLSLINGMIGYIDKIDLSSYKKNSLKIDFRPDFLTDEKFRRILIDPSYAFMSYEEKQSFIQSPFDVTNKFEFGYAITVHLSQGSQFNNVLVIDEYIPNKLFYKQLMYTAITRAVEGLIIAM